MSATISGTQVLPQLESILSDVLTRQALFPTAYLRAFPTSSLIEPVVQFFTQWRDVLIAKLTAGPPFSLSLLADFCKMPLMWEWMLSPSESIIHGTSETFMGQARNLAKARGLPRMPPGALEGFITGTGGEVELPCTAFPDAKASITQLKSNLQTILQDTPHNITTESLAEVAWSFFTSLQQDSDWSGFGVPLNDTQAIELIFPLLMHLLPIEVLASMKEHT